MLALKYAHIARRSQQEEEISRNIVVTPEGVTGFKIEFVL
jgi:hypothetical protein